MSKDADNDQASDKKASELLEHPAYEELLKKLDEADQKANQNWERFLRAQAENENLQRRAKRDVAEAEQYALKKFVAELIPIVDSLELCISNAHTSKEAAKSVLEGVELTLKMFHTAMEKFGITQINPLNEPFDPEFQQAISIQVDPKVKPGTVVSVLQKGYTLNNRLVRPALVVVSKDKE